MMGWYAHMGQTRVYPDSPMSIVALQDEVGLSNDQVKQLTSIQERANSDAKAVLTQEQRAKLGNRYEELETNVYVPMLEFDEPIIP